MTPGPKTWVGALLVLALLTIPAGIVWGSGPRGAGAQMHAADRPTAPVVPAPDAAPAAAPSGSALAGRLHGLENVLSSRDVPAQDIHFPDLSAETPGRTGIVTPSYLRGPDPVGVADLGIRNLSGTLTPYAYNTSSVQGVVNLTEAQALTLEAASPGAFAIELSAVATNVTLFGVRTDEFWTQEFASYNPLTATLQLGDNVWNFSGPSGAISANALYAHGPNGTMVAPVFYYGEAAPIPAVHYPFVLTLYLNASLQSLRPAVFFNYTLTSPTVTTAGSIDYVVFNASTPPVVAPAPPQFQVNGTGVDPVGLPNDFELVVVGDGDGATASFLSMTATLLLSYLGSGSYVTVPAAYNAGSDTGQTSEGVFATYTVPFLLPGSPVANLSSGPSYVDGLWNVSPLAGAQTILLHQSPPNAFLWVNSGSTARPAIAEWVPTFLFSSSGSTFELPNGGSFYFTWLMSGHRTLTDALPAPLLPNLTTIIYANLTAVASVGVDAPLMAWGAAELAAISQSGSGTNASPYLLHNRPSGGLNPLFGQVNDFAYPVFPGVLVWGSTSYVDVFGSPTRIVYGSWTTPTLTAWGLPTTNDLPIVLGNVTNVTVAGSTVSGWLPSVVGSAPAGELLLWASEHNLVAENTFDDEGAGITLFGGGNNTVWGNTFEPVASGATPASATLGSGNEATGVLEWEVRDLVYNNYFALPRPAATATFDPTSCQLGCVAASYLDAWNVSRRPANAARNVLGTVLEGSIIGTSYQGGNFWSNYGLPGNPFGDLPYDDSGQIAVQGDYVPLTASAIYSVTFAEAGLPSGTEWGETLLGITNSTTAPSQITVYAPNGTYNFTVTTLSGFSSVASGSFVVNGSNVTVPTVTFYELFTEPVSETGLVSNWTWTVIFTVTAGTGGTNATVSSSGTTAAVALANATYRYRVSAFGYASTPAGGTLTVRGAPAPISVRFTLIPLLNVSSSGLGPDAPWTVTVTQGSTVVNETGIGDGSLVFTVLEIRPGVPLGWTVVAAGYSAEPQSGTANRTVTFTPLPGPAAGVNWLWAVVGVLAALAATGFGLFALARRRGPRPPSPIVPAGAATAAATAPKPWDETAADREQAPSPAPWQEGPEDAERSQPYRSRP